MSITLFWGVPGSGKSFHTSQIIYNALRKGQNVITNVNINTSLIPPISDSRPLGNFIFVPPRQFEENAISIKNSLGGKSVCDSVYSYIFGLQNFALQFHKRNNRGQITESQTLLIIDECHHYFDPRSWNRKDRSAWVDFFSVHRHYGFDVLLISQKDSRIDKQIRGLIEKQVMHRNVSKYKRLGKLLASPFGGNLFICIESMYDPRMSKKDAHIKSYFIYGSNYYFSLYDSYSLII